MGCCRSGLNPGISMPSENWKNVAKVQAAPASFAGGSTKDPCYFVELNGDFLSFSVENGVLSVHLGAEKKEAFSFLQACTGPKALLAREVVKRFEKRVQELFLLNGNRRFTLAFLKMR